MWLGWGYQIVPLFLRPNILHGYLELFEIAACLMIGDICVAIK
jgi:hypothetical protein